MRDDLAAARQAPQPVALLPEVTCPHCWQRCPPHKLRWIARHDALRGDPVLGPEAHLRFAPSRFTVHGDAIDPQGSACSQLACPRCHLEIPRLCVEARPVFLSLIGAPGSGKSNFLAAMTWLLRKEMASRFRLHFADADPQCNAALAAYEHTLFFQDDEHAQVVLDKTQLHGELYQSVQIDEQPVFLPRPFLFALGPAAAHPLRRDGESAGAGYVLCLYDNAGEHFLPGADTACAPGTQHLGVSELLLFVFDPTQEPRFRRACREISDDPQLLIPVPPFRQDLILSEAAVRIRRHAHLPAQAPLAQPLLVLASKADIWSPLLQLDLEEPYLEPPEPGAPWVIDEDRLEEVTGRVRALLQELCPQLVALAEGISRRVVYFPVSALGRSPVRTADGRLAVPAREIRPRWVTVPLMYAISKWMLPGLVRRVHRVRGARPAAPPAAPERTGQRPPAAGACAVPAPQAAAAPAPAPAEAAAGQGAGRARAPAPGLVPAPAAPLQPLAADPSSTQGTGAEGGGGA
ncbi:MAG: hypothetical protein KatS3mg102_0276 [Planctomycetota bacterium]|nr:MAG: hypothetical protein KatS3mg102_0276 [Planctomycetota bacterium]